MPWQRVPTLRRHLRVVAPRLPWRNVFECTSECPFVVHNAGGERSSSSAFARLSRPSFERSTCSSRSPTAFTCVCSCSTPLHEPLQPLQPHAHLCRFVYLRLCRSTWRRRRHDSPFVLVSRERISMLHRYVDAMISIRIGSVVDRTVHPMDRSVLSGSKTPLKPGSIGKWDKVDGRKNAMAPWTGRNRPMKDGETEQRKRCTGGAQTPPLPDHTQCLWLQ